jgi:hypothetical protein
MAHANQLTAAARCCRRLLMKPFSPKDAAAALQVSYSGLRYFELLGKLKPMLDSAGRRTYDPRDVDRLAKARATTVPTSSK